VWFTHIYLRGAMVGVATALSLRSHMIGCFHEENADVLKNGAISWPLFHLNINCK
jgi:hypothetical protein